MDGSFASTDIKGFPTYSELSDAMRYSLICIVSSLAIIAVTWRSYPCCCTVAAPMPEATTEKEKKAQEGMEGRKLFKINFAWPFKILTVLFHEMSHAIVGLCTGGRVGYISVNDLMLINIAREGGSTYFKPDPKHQPWLRTTLAAGYLGSCLIGCALLASGFDALMSKYAALALLTYLGITIIICGSIRTEFALGRAWNRVVCYVQKWFGSDASAGDRLAELKEHDEKMLRKARLFSERQAQVQNLTERLAAGTISAVDQEELERLEEKLENSYKKKMVAVDLIACIALFICSLIIPAWLIADSVALRFVIMFIGLFSGVYAVQDVYDDGVKNYQALGSDANVYASLMIPPPPGIDWYYDFQEPKIPKVLVWEAKVASRTKYLAWLSLIMQLFAILVTILVAIYLVRTTTAEQALRSRSFLPTPFHLRSADMLDKTQKGAEEALRWGKDKLGELLEGDGER